MKKTATALATAVAAFVAGVIVMVTPAHADQAARYESKRLDMKVWTRCTNTGLTRVVVRLHDTRPPNPDATPEQRMRPYAWTWKHSDDGDPWNSWGGGSYTENQETVYLRWRIHPGEEWLRVAVSDETDTEFAQHMMLDRRFHAREC